MDILKGINLCILLCALRIFGSVNPTSDRPDSSESQGNENTLLETYDRWLKTVKNNNGETTRRMLVANSLCTNTTLDDIVTVNCSHQDLHYIPELDGLVENLIFEYNKLDNVTRETFVNISQPNKLIGLQISYDNIRNISSDALDSFVNLTFLHISGNPLYFGNLKHLLGSTTNLPHLQYLRMSDISTITLNSDLFSLMTGTRIEMLILHKYETNSFNMKILQNIIQLKTLALSDNDIHELLLWKFPKLNNLYLDKNKLQDIPNFCLNRNHSNSYFPHIHTLVLNSNQISTINRGSFKCLSSLIRIEINFNYISNIANDFLLNTPKLIYFESKNQMGKNPTIGKYAFRSKSISYLKFGFLGSATSIFPSLNDVFKFSPSLKKVLIDTVHMSDMTGEMLRALFGPLTKLTQFQCFKCTISQDPKYILEGKPKLRMVMLGGNSITTLSKETFADNTHLKYLKLRYNKIGHIDEAALPKDMLNRLDYLDLSMNPFTCDCSLQWFIDWLKSNKTKNTLVNRYPQDYRCSNPANKLNVKLSEVRFTFEECHPWIWVVIILCPCLVLSGIIGLIIYLNRWNIKHYIYLLRKRRNYQPLEGHDYIYDAFVSYDSNDSDWVRGHLIPNLENNEGLKLCIHERDFQAGVFINDNIVKAMDASEKIILILTNTFTKSGWCMFELKVAQSKLIEGETDLVIVMLEKIKARNMNRPLKMLLETTTFLEWTEDQVGQELFWTKLKDALRK